MKKLLLILMFVSVVSSNTKLNISQTFIPRYTASETVISNFDGGAGVEWVLTSGVSAEDETTLVRNGTKSVKVTGSYATSTSAVIRKTISATAFDTIHSFALTYHMDDGIKELTNGANSLSLTFTTSTGNYYFKEYNVTSVNPFDSGWYKIIIHRSSLVAVGTPSWSSITSISVTLKNSVNSSRQIVFDQLAMIKSPVKAGVIFWFDAISIGIYDYARPIFDRYGFKFTESVKARVIGDDGIQTLTQLKQIQAEGHDLVSYPWDATSLTTLSPIGVDTQLTKIKTYMVENGFPLWKFLALSQTAHNRIVDSIAFSKGFEWLRGTNLNAISGVSYLPVPQYTNRAFGQYVYTTESSATLTGIIDTIIKYGIVAPILFHGVTTDGSSSIIDTTKLVALLDYCKQKITSGELGYAGKISNYFVRTPAPTITLGTDTLKLNAKHTGTTQWLQNGSVIGSGSSVSLNADSAFYAGTKIEAITGSNKSTWQFKASGNKRSINFK